MGHSPSRTGDRAADETYTEVRYGETDQMGFAHHATAVLWFELGRVTWLRKRGLSYGELEASGVLLPVVEMNIKYHAPGRFEDPLAIQTQLVRLGKTRVTFENKVFRIEKSSSRILLVSGVVELACLAKDGRIQRVPAAFQELWKQAGAGHKQSLG